ncbi:MAG TPA: peptidylprolyl isomerase [Steroidobacteraceae bacterium]|jgi:peptidylprolyl isomerase|nr:peptidylprolyl isomerase [Steroidobacteraceae bacterium]
MKILTTGLVLAVAALTMGAAAAAGKTMAEVLDASKPGDWRTLDPENTLYMELAGGRVVIELAPQFAPRHVENVRKLVRGKYFDGLTIVRSQDNFVVQWADPADADHKKPLGDARKTLEPEFERPAAGLKFIALPDPDTYAQQTGFVAGFPAARDKANGTAWPVHCYAMVGAGRDNAVDTGPGTEIYVVSGHSPRQLDRNVALFGRVVWGMELLAIMPRGPAPMGFYDKAEMRVPIREIRVAADVPAEQRTKLELLRTDTQTFTDLIEARRNRQDEWYKYQANRIDVCNVPMPVRAAK